MKIVTSLLCALSGILSAAEPPAPEVVPQGLASSDWSSIRAAYQAGRHAVVADKGGSLVARNPGQHWNTSFDGRGFTTTPDTGDWSWGFDLKSYGFQDSSKTVADKATVSHEGGKVLYQWDGNLCEWFINDTRGVEQGWTFKHRPQGAAADKPLHLDLAVRGGLVPEVSGDGASVSFLNETGGSALTYGGLTAYDADGIKLAVRFESAGKMEIRVSVEERAARYPITIDPLAQQAYLKASNPGGAGKDKLGYDYSGDAFGSSVSVSKNTVVVGAPYEGSDASGINGDQSNNRAISSGAVYVFVRTNGGWTQEAYIKASNPGGASPDDDNFYYGGDGFGRSLAIDGDTLVVGASSEDSNATGVNGDQSNNAKDDSGAVYVFTRSGGFWSQQAYLKASNTGWDDLFGSSVAVSGDTLVVGSPWEDSNATGVNGNQASDTKQDSGAAYVFTRSGVSWSQQAYLKASNTGKEDDFGTSVGVSGDTVAIGAPYTGSDYEGAVYVFKRNSGIWTQQAYLQAFDAFYQDFFGDSLAIDGDTLVVGAPGVGDLGYTYGGAYVFVRNGDIWSQQAMLQASYKESQVEFGSSVAISGNTILVGAPDENSSATGINGNQADNNALFSGAAYLFSRTGEIWKQTAYLKASNTGGNYIAGYFDDDGSPYLGGDHFGTSVAISGSLLAVGAVEEDGKYGGVNGYQGNNNSKDSGAAYLFDLNSPAAPELSIEDGSGRNLAIGGTAHTFGKVKPGEKSTQKFVIRNKGSANLTGLAITKYGRHTGDYLVAGLTTRTLAPGANTTFTVTFKPKAGGLRSAAIHIASNDADENPFDIQLTGTAIVPSPEIVVQQPVGNSLVDGTAKKSFGTVKVGKFGTVKTFTIKNTGKAKLTGLAITKNGTHPYEFIASAVGKTSLAPGTFTTFAVWFQPRASGTRNAVIHIKSNDANENPFDIKLTGKGAAP